MWVFKIRTHTSLIYCRLWILQNDIDYIYIFDDINLYSISTQNIYDDRCVNRNLIISICYFFIFYLLIKLAVYSYSFHFFYS